jgi:diguanylate cyclase (GGDEF)-like protein
VGILPVLWPVAKTPDRHELRLLYGLAGHVGLALVQRELREMRAEAATDPLTSLLNRRAIGDELAMFVARAGRAEGRVGVLFLDLDGFKLVNDQRGHEAGDAVLERVAGAVRSALRQGDVVGRYGGDEMLVVAADAGAGEATALARRIRAAVRGVAGEDGVDVTIGIAIFPDAGRTEADLMAAADQAMYRGKLRGPGHIVVADGATRDTATSA